MAFFHINRIPDKITVQLDEEWIELNHNQQDNWQKQSVEVVTQNSSSGLHIALTSPAASVRRVKLRWRQSITEDLLFLNDHWERGYGDLEWRKLIPERIFPWYFMAFDGTLTQGYGVKTGPAAMCFWQVDTSGVSLWLDVRCGGAGVQLGQRTLQVATIITYEGSESEPPFQAARSFCRMMCDRPVMPDFPIYGGNNWYYAYGRSSHQQILDDAKLMASVASAKDNRPFMVIDGGWEMIRIKGPSGGPWHAGNYLFPDMPKLAEEMKEIGTRPGLWFRPLSTRAKVPEDWILPDKRFKASMNGQFLDPSIPEVLDLVTSDVNRFVTWGYEMIKHDFSTFDLFGRWGFEMNDELTESGWSFADRTRTTAEIIICLYQTISKAAGDALIIGCNTIGHLAAGIFAIQRTGDDTSGKVWEKTRKRGINTLAFRLPQHGAFFAVDADCVGLTTKIPWEMNKQWLNLLAQSGTPLFVSVSPDAAGKEQKRALRDAFEMASKPLPIAEPLDWLQTTCPAQWLLNEKQVSFDWFGDEGVAIF